MANLPKDALILCLDVGHGMQASLPGQKTHLEKAIEIMSMLVQRKIFAQSKDELALVLFGCDESDNPLQEGDSYSNICVKFPLGPANFDMLQHITQDINPGNNETDFLDAITVCLDILYNETRNKKIGCRRIVLFSNFNHPCNVDNIDGIINGFAADGMDVELNIIGTSIKDDTDDSDDDEKPGPSNAANHDPDVDDVTGKRKTQHQIDGENVVRQILNSGVSGSSYSYSCASQAASGFEKRSVKSAAWKCNLTLGQDLSIPCVAYAKTKEAKLKQTWKKCHAKTNKEEDILPNRYFHRNDEDQTEVEKENVGKGYRYGKDVIPFGPEDEKQMKYSTDGKSLNLLGFTSTDNVPSWYMMDDQAHYVLPDDQNASTGLHALIIAMQKQDLCGIARYVYRKGSNPKLVALLPHIRNGYRCLVMVALPFAEDIRPLSFPSLQSVTTNDEQLQAIDRLIDNNTRDDIHDPKSTLNPFFQHTYHCLRNRFLNPNENLPEQSVATGSAAQLPSLSNVDDVKRLFSLVTSSEPSTAPKRWKDLDTDETKIKSEDESYQPLATILAPQVDNVGTVTPDSDFLAILENSSNNADRISMAFKQLRERIEGFVYDPFLLKLSNKIITGLKVLVEKSEQYNQVEATNCFLVKIKNKLMSSQLWKLIVENQINLIGDGDYEGNNRSNFHSTELATANNPVYQEDTEQDADDLLDMME